MFEEFLESDKKKNEEFDKRITAIEKQNDAIAEGVKEMLLDRILYLGTEFIKDGEITLDNRNRLHRMHKSYHYGLNGNGDADWVMEGVDDLPLSK